MSINTLHIVLEDLIEQKAKKDGVGFNSAQLANALEMPRSMITRLIHADPKKRVTNPRIDTLIKIVNYFHSNGISITLNELLGLNYSIADAQDQNLQQMGIIQQSIPLYSFNAKKMDALGIADIALNGLVPNAIALLANNDIKPMFKKGSIFIIDTTAPIEDDTLVAIRIDGYKEIQIRKFADSGQKQILKSFSLKDEPTLLTTKLRQQIIGVVVQVNAKT